jgi:hypothetical protein
VAKTLEDAIWLKLTGQSEAARAIFQDELKPFKNLPIISLEHADFELENGRWGRAWRILDSCLSTLKDNSANPGLPEHRLMALTRAMLGIRHRGDHATAAWEVERTRLWLQHVPVAEYTDIQVSLFSGASRSPLKLARSPVASVDMSSHTCSFASALNMTTLMWSIFRCPPIGPSL